MFNNIEIPCIKYLFLTLKHKWFVFLEGRRTGVGLWRLIIRDWSKFCPSELPHYGKQFFGKADDPKGFVGCWIRHQNRHFHHWEYWIPRTSHNRCMPPYKDNEPVPMSMWAVREMVADWMGASWAYNKKRVDVDNWKWFHAEYPKIRARLHVETRLKIHAVLCSLKSKQRYRRW